MVRQQVHLALRRAELARVHMHGADPGLDKLVSLGAALFVFGQPSEAVLHQTAVQGAARERGEALAQAPQNVVERKECATPKLNDNGLLDLGQHGAVRPAWPHRLIGRGGALAPLGDCLCVQAVAALLHGLAGWGWVA